MNEIIAVIFDFDDTLAPDSTTGYLRQRGVDVVRFWERDVKAMMEARKMDDEWDPVPAYMYRMLEQSGRGAPVGPITRDNLAQWGRELPLYPGVESIFGRLRAVVQAANPRVQLEFYVLSSGIGEVLKHTPIAGEFAHIWASDFAYDERGHIEFPRKIISFTDKTRYLFHVQKGIFGEKYVGKPFEVNRKTPPAQLRVPFNQMIMVGDGYTDVPCFSLLKREEGIPIGVYTDTEDRDKRSRAWGFIEDQRVSNLARADYSEGSDLSHSLTMAVENIVRRLSLAAHTYQG